MERAYLLSYNYQYYSFDIAQIHIAICNMLEQMYMKINDKENANKYKNESIELEKYLLRLMGYLQPEIDEFMLYHHNNNTQQIFNNVNEEIIEEKENNDIPKKKNKRKKKKKIVINNNDNKEAIDQPISFNEVNEENKIYQLGYAAKKGKRELVQRYLESGFDPNIRNPLTGYTPLHYACWHEYKDIIMLLLQYNADPLIKNNEGETCLDTAKLSKNDEIIELLNNKIKELHSNEEIERKEIERKEENEIERNEIKENENSIKPNIENETTIDEDILNALKMKEELI